MSQKDYVAQYIALEKVGKWFQPGQGSPKYSFKANDDEEALDIALSFEKKPKMYMAGIRKVQPIPGAKYELIKLSKTENIPITRRAPRKGLEVCVGKNDFNFFV